MIARNDLLVLHKLLDQQANLQKRQELLRTIWQIEQVILAEEAKPQADASS